MQAAAWIERFGELVRREPVPLAAAALALGAVDHDVSEQPVLDAFDALAAPVLPGSLDSLRAELFGPGRFTGNSADYYDPANSYIDRVLQRRLGIPISLAVVAMEVGARCGVPLAGIGLPGHFIVRSVKDPTVYVDQFNGGALVTAEDCRSRFRRDAPAGSTWSDRYLDPVDSAAMLYRMTANLLVIHRSRRDLAGMVHVLRLRVLLPGATPEDRAELDAVLARLN